jgi:hypothetical protein
LPELGWIIEMVAYDVSVNVVFLGGADFDSPPPLGTTGRSRYVKVKTVEEAQAPEMHKWIEQPTMMSSGFLDFRRRAHANLGRDRSSGRGVHGGQVRSRGTMTLDWSVQRAPQPGSMAEKNDSIGPAVS